MFAAEEQDAGGWPMRATFHSDSECAGEKQVWGYLSLNTGSEKGAVLIAVHSAIWLQQVS